EEGRRPRSRQDDLHGGSQAPQPGEDQAGDAVGEATTRPRSGPL
ncbi:MAG: hypothetical protein AVDCRST_MAG60-805, partial [uncultured Nocardioides sp.]